MSPDITATLIPKLEELPMLQLLNTPPSFINPPSASCPPSIAGSPPNGPTSPFNTSPYQMHSPNGASVFSTSCPPKSTNPGVAQNIKQNHMYQSQPSSPRHASPRSSISEGSSQKPKIPRHKRPSHINAEHRRRCKIQVKIIAYSRGKAIYFII